MRSPPTMFRFNRPQLLQNNQQTKLYNEKTFYGAFMPDLASAKHEVIIESPYITAVRMKTVLPVLQKLRRKNIKVIVNTRNPFDHESRMRFEASSAISDMQEIGVKVLYTGGLHRKLAIIDREILYEGSLNILSQYDSCEIMRRIKSQNTVLQMINYIKY